MGKFGKTVLNVLNVLVFTIFEKGNEPECKKILFGGLERVLPPIGSLTDKKVVLVS